MPDFNPQFQTHRAPSGLLERALEKAERRSPWRDSRALLAAACFLFGVGFGGVVGWVEFAGQGESPGDSLPPARPTPVVAGASRVVVPAVVPVRFVFPAPGAEHVSLAGSWNGWNETAHPLVRGEGDVFYLVVPLAPGQYEYQFVVDGDRWQPDPSAPLARDDGFGRRNSVLTI